MESESDSSEPDLVQILVLAVENCTELFGNASLAAAANVTCLDHAPTLTKQATVRAITLALMSVLSLVGNVLAIVAIVKDPHRTSLCMMILHLSVADLFVAFFCLAGESIWTYTVSWNAGNIMCKAVKYWQMFGLYLSTFLVVVIGLDRWIAISQPLKRSTGGKKSTKRLIFCAWMLSAIFSLPQLAIFRVLKGPFQEDFEQCVTYGFYTARWQEQTYSILSLLFMFVLPLAILLVTYTCALIRLKASERSFEANEKNNHSILSHTEKNRQKRMRKATRRSLQMSFFIVLGFLACWMPYYSASIILLFGLVPDQYSKQLLDAIFCFGMSNSLINPLIYGAFHLWRPAPGPAMRGMTMRLQSVRRRFSTTKSSFNSSQLACGPFASTLTSGVLATPPTRRTAAGGLPPRTPSPKGLPRPPRPMRDRSLMQAQATQPQPRSLAGARASRAWAASRAMTLTSESMSSQLRPLPRPRPRPPPLLRCNTTALDGSGVVLHRPPVGGHPGHVGHVGPRHHHPPKQVRDHHTQTSPLLRCATLDCTSQVDRRKVSMRRRQLKAARADSSAINGLSNPINYSQEILGRNEEIV